MPRDRKVCKNWLRRKTVSILDQAVEKLKAGGVNFLSEVAPGCSGTGNDEFGIVHAIDPDGVFLELVGAIARQELPPPPEGCPALVIKMPPETP